MKVSPISEIPHKSKAFRSILDLSFSLKITPCGRVPSVNKNSEKTALGGAIDKIGHVLLRLIRAFAEAPDCAKISQAKWDMKDGFWRLDCKEVEEWNFCYLLPQNPCMPKKVVVPTSLQMGWIESPPCFCIVSETVQYVAEQYIETPVLSLAPHNFVNLTEVNSDFAELPKKDTLNEPFNYMLEVYMDDYISLSIPRIQDQLDHVVNSIMKEIHDVFPPDKYDKEDAISLKKILKKESVWTIIKNLLGFEFDEHPGEYTIWLTEDLRTDILKKLKRGIR